MTPAAICARLVDERDAGDCIVRVDDVEVRSAGEAARRFGLRASAEIYGEIPREEARAVLVAVLTRDMAYDCELMTASAAASLADQFLAQFDAGSARCFTNAGHPATDATFDTGILVLDAGRVGCAWFMDED